MRGSDVVAFQKPHDFRAKLRGIFRSQIGYHWLSECLMQALMAPENSCAGLMGSLWTPHSKMTWVLWNLIRPKNILGSLIFWDFCFLKLNYCHSTEPLAQATSARLFGKSSTFSTINLLPCLQHLALLMIPSVLNFSFLGFHHITLLGSLFLSSLLSPLLPFLPAPRMEVFCGFLSCFFTSSAAGLSMLVSTPVVSHYSLIINPALVFFFSLVLDRTRTGQTV